MVLGRASILFEKNIYIEETGSVAGQKEAAGPLGECFDEVASDPLGGEKNWEQAESRMQRQAVESVLRKSGVSVQNIRYVLGGDLLGQTIATSFGAGSYDIPCMGLYSACATMAEGLMLGAMLLEAGYGDHVLAVTSSHFASAEKQFRFPLSYGNQRPYSATWTVTGAAAVLLGRTGGAVRIAGVTTGRIVDLGIKDSMNLGAAMAPAAADVIMQHFIDTDRQPDDYDRIITGDLGMVGMQALHELLLEEGVCPEKRLVDCGRIIYREDEQDTHAGGSGCACSALVLCAYILRMLREGHWRRVLFVPTGALLSQMSFYEGRTIPGIAHAIVLEAGVQCL